MISDRDMWTKTPAHIETVRIAAHWTNERYSEFKIYYIRGQYECVLNDQAVYFRCDTLEEAQDYVASRYR